MQSGPVKKPKNVITGCYKWHTTVYETRNLKASFAIPLKTWTNVLLSKMRRDYEIKVELGVKQVHCSYDHNILLINDC